LCKGDRVNVMREWDGDWFVAYEAVVVKVHPDGDTVAVRNDVEGFWSRVRLFFRDRRTHWVEVDGEIEKARLIG
jgi:hypothetical protein